MSTVGKIKPNIWIFLMIVLAVGTFAAAQAPQPTDTDQSQKKGAKATEKQPNKKHSLTDATRASTDLALEDAAKQAATKPEPSKETSATEAVVEFHPAEAEATTSTSVKTDAQKSKKKNIHGTAYGAANPKNSGTHREGGAVGATSKSGKTSVYVETERDRTTTPH